MDCPWNTRHWLEAISTEMLLPRIYFYCHQFQFSQVRAVHFWKHLKQIPLLLFLFIFLFFTWGNVVIHGLFQLQDPLVSLNLLAHWSASPVELRLTVVTCAAPLGSRLLNEARGEEREKKEVLLNNTRWQEPQCRGKKSSHLSTGCHSGGGVYYLPVGPQNTQSTWP